MNKGIIYIIKCKDKNIKDCYIGSTTNLKKRIINHKTTCKIISNKNYKSKKYQFIRNNGGFDNFYFEILEDDIEFNNRKELNKIERYYIEEFKSSLNSDIPTRTNKEKDKQYYIKNKEKIKEEKKKYRKKYYKQNKDKINEKLKININCNCGSIIRKAEYPRHCRSIKHLDFVNNKTI